MTTSEENRKCDREVGSPAKGWHCCGRTAAYLIYKVSPTGYPLEFGACHRHLEALQQTTRASRLVRTVPVRP